MRPERPLLIGCFLLLLALPGLQMRYRFVPEEKLSGVSLEAERPPFTLAGWWSGDLQTRLEAWFDQHIGFRGHAVRTDNQIGLTLFREASSKARDTPVLGARMQVYEDGYVLAYDGQDPYTDRGLRRLAGRLRRVQDVLAARGIAFALVIAPNKAALYPEYLPWGFVHPDGERPPTAYERMLPMLSAAGVHVVDGHAILAEEKARSPRPLFPPGGVHWNRYAAHLVVRRLFEVLGGQLGRPLPALRCRAVTEDDRPLPADPDSPDQETDAADLLNAWHVGHGDWTFPRPQLYLEDGGQADRPRLLIVGDSFWTLPAAIIADLRMAARTDFYYYFNQIRPRTQGAAEPPLTQPGDADASLTWQRVLSADAVVIEVNEIMIGQAGFGFVDQTLRNPALNPAARGGPAADPPRRRDRARGPER